VAGDADDDAAEDVDGENDEARDRVAADEFRRAVHGAEEVRFGFQLLPPLARFPLVDEARGKVGIDGHLLSRHRVQGEARRDFGDAAGALRDHDEVHDDQDREDDDADDEVALRDQAPEGLNHLAGGIRSFIPMRQDEPRRGEIERHPQHRRDQKHRGKRAEFERLPDEHRRHQDQNREGNRKRERDVQQPGRKRQQKHDEDRENADGERDFAVLQIVADGVQRPLRSGPQRSRLRRHESVPQAISRCE